MVQITLKYKTKSLKSLNSRIVFEKSFDNLIENQLLKIVKPKK